MGILKIEIEGHGEFKVRADMLHRHKSYLKTFDKGRFKEVQFNSYNKDIECYTTRNPFQDGYDYNGDEIRIKVLK